MDAAREAMLVLRQGIDRADGAVADRGEDVLFGDHQGALRADYETRRRLRLGRTGFDRPRLAPPFLHSAVQHGRVGEPEHAEEPPNPGRPVDILAAVEHDASAGCDAPGAHHRRELRGSGGHQRHRMARIGKLGQHVDELRPGDVCALEVIRARADFEHRHRVEGEMDRAIDNTQVWIPEMRRQPFGFDQKFGMDEIFRSCRHFPPLAAGQSVR